MSRTATERPFTIKRPVVLALSAAWILCLAIGGAVALRPGSGLAPDKSAATTAGAAVEERTQTTASATAPPAPFTPIQQPPQPPVTGQALQPPAPVLQNAPVQRQPILSAPAPNDHPVTPAKESAVPVTKAGIPQPAAIVQNSPAGMPPDVLDWLRHLERTEYRRRSLAKSQIEQLLSEFSTMISAGYAGLADPDEIASVSERDRARNLDRLSKRIRECRSEWDALSASFWSLRAPEACARTAADFGKTLGQTTQMMDEVFTFVVNGHTAPQQSLEGLYKMTGTSASRIDAPAKDADADVQDVCDRYGVKKWFSIQPDVGGGLGGILGSIGR